MIDSAAVTHVANEAHVLINAATVAFLTVIGIVSYIAGLIRGKKIAAKPVDGVKA
jgi:hypothetical protein